MSLLCTPGGIVRVVLQSIAARHAVRHQPGCHACSAVLQAALWRSSLKPWLSPRPSASLSLPLAHLLTQDSPLLQVSLTVLAGKCRFAFAYGYYQDPLVQGLNPLRGPRYGSFPLQVHLQDQVVLLQDAVSSFVSATKCTNSQMRMAPAGPGSIPAITAPIKWALSQVASFVNHALSTLTHSMLQCTTLQQIRSFFTAALACKSDYVTPTFARLALGA